MILLMALTLILGIKTAGNAYGVRAGLKSGDTETEQR
jgi:hypothetical protein